MDVLHISVLLSIVHSNKYSLYTCMYVQNSVISTCNIPKIAYVHDPCVHTHIYTHTVRLVTLWGVWCQWIRGCSPFLSLLSLNILILWRKENMEVQMQWPPNYWNCEAAHPSSSLLCSLCTSISHRAPSCLIMMTSNSSLLNSLHSSCISQYHVSLYGVLLGPYWQNCHKLSTVLSSPPPDHISSLIFTTPLH